MLARTLTTSQVEKTRTFPQELVDKIIDELADLPNGPIHPIAVYSLVSRAWVARTQKHHFRWTYFHGWGELEKWCRSIAPDPDWVSRHVCDLVLNDINALKGSEAHLRAFTRVKDMKIVG